MRFGLDVAQHQLQWSEILDRVRFAEETGFDGAWLFDHFTALYGDADGPCLEGWTLLAGIAAHTVSIRLGTLVTGITHRLPSVLASQAVTVDHISDGRLELAIGAAWNDEEHEELGIAFPDADERMDRLEESVQILRLLMTEDDVTFDGEYYELRNATYRPRPVQQPHPPIWIGGTGRRRLLPIAGRHADVWHGWGTKDELREMFEVIDQAAAEAGRSPQDIARASSLSISEPWDAVRREFDYLAEAGISYLVVEWPSEGWARIQEFVEKVWPVLQR